MASVSLSSRAPNHGLSTNHGALRCGYPTEPYFMNTEGTSPPLRLIGLTLDELREELERRTHETQRLQEEVDKETREALERFGCASATNGSAESSCRYQGFPITHQQDAINTLVNLDALNPQCFDNGSSSLPIDDAAPQHLSNLQLNKEEPNPQALMSSFQSRLQRVQMEKDKLLDLRVKDSKNHVEQMEKMLCIVEELQNIKRSSQQILQETEEETLTLKRNVASVDSNGRQLQSVAGNASRFNYDRETLQERILSTKENLQNNENNQQNNQERLRSLITDVGQEMEVLADNLNSCKDRGSSLNTKMELLKILEERQTSLHQHHINELESLVVFHKDEVSGMEQQLIVVQNQLSDAERERNQMLQQAQEFQSQLAQLQRCCEQQQWELQDQVKVLKRQLELGRERLHKAGKETSRLQELLDKKVKERDQSVELLRKKEEEVWIVQQETQQYHAKLEVAQRQCQTLRAEQETQTLELADKRQMIDSLRLEMENNVQMMLKHRQTINSLQKENSLLSNQLNQHKLEIQQLRVQVNQQKADMAAAELERRQLLASITEQSQRIHERTEEKQQLETMLELHKMQLNTLTKKHSELQQVSSWEKEEHVSAVVSLQNHLKSAHNELEHIKSTHRNLQVADGHDMLKEVTASREQVDLMQRRIQILQENVEKLYQERSYQASRAQCRQQELVYVREQRKQFASELEALRSKDQQLQERISELEALHHKLSESFASCQDFMQLQEQEYFRLKLQHTLDLKELRGQPVPSALNTPPPDVDSPTPAPLTAPCSSQQDSNSQIKQQLGAESKKQCESRVSVLRSPVKDQQGVTSENIRPHTDHSFYRRRSAPERKCTVTFAEGDETRGRTKTVSSKPPSLRATQSNGPALKRSISESHVVSSTVGRHLLSSHLLSPGRKSPVYCLLTSDPTRDELFFK